MPGWALGAMLVPLMAMVSLGLARPVYKTSKVLVTSGANKVTSAKPARPQDRPPDPMNGVWPAHKNPQLGNGTLASEVLVSALRVMGLRDSFDENTFIRHVLYVNAIMRKDELPRESFASALLTRLAARGLLQRDRMPRRGDVVFFRLSQAQGSGGGRVLAGVVDSVAKERFTFIAPLGGKVGRGVASIGRNKKDDTKLIQQCGKAARCKAGELLIGTVDTGMLGRTRDAITRQP